MNEQMPAILSNAILSDNIQDTVLTIRSKIFSVQAQKIEETVDGTTNLNSEYKEYDIAGKLHESYAGPYEVTQQGVNITLGVGYNSDKYLANGIYKHTRKGNTIKLVSLGSTQICIGVNSAHRGGVLGSVSVMRNLLLLGASVKVTLLGLSLYVANISKVIGASVSLVGVHVERASITTRIVDGLKNVISSYTERRIIDKKGMITTIDGVNRQLYQ